MSKHRTKEQKLKAAEARRLQAGNQNTAVVELVTPVAKPQLNSSPKTSLQWGSAEPAQSTQSAQSAQKSNRLIFGFDPEWVYRDLRKTAVVSCLIVGILVFIYYLIH